MLVRRLGTRLRFLLTPPHKPSPVRSNDMGQGKNKESGPKAASYISVIKSNYNIPPSTAIT